jgi:erythromycin esterase
MADVAARPSRDRCGLRPLCRASWQLAPTVMGHRYDAFCFFEETQALHPLHAERPQLMGEQETYPTGR